ncbi:peptidoglycan D,D-transpeptidase FtsI family protein [Sutcliffiella cohnii]
MTNKKQNKKKKNIIPYRLNLLFFVVFLLFSALILRLGFVQIVYGEKYRVEVDRTENITVNTPVPRGKVYDRNGDIVVDNEPLNAITYTRTGSTKEQLEVAEKLATVIEVTEEMIDKIQVRDKKDFWLLKNEEEAKELITDEDRQKVTEGELVESDLYRLQIERITEKQYESFTKDELKVLAIFRAMNRGYALTPQIIKNTDVSDEEIAIISERLSEFPGVDTTVDWNRKMIYGSTLRTLLGNITTSDQGLPSERLSEYLAKGYSRNDRVGTSFIEAEYEQVLRGQKARIRNVTDQSGKLLHQETVFEGQRGKDLVLSIDIELQQRIEEVITNELLEEKKLAQAARLDRAFVVILDPNTGEVLSLAGKVLTKDENGGYEVLDHARGTFQEAYHAGSTVKGATVLTGYETGVISPGTVLYDTPLKVAQDRPKGSWQNMGNIDDLTALERSSNVYMFRTAIRIANGNYQYGQPLPIDPAGFDRVRYYFNQFGLGVRTGIDLPAESSGFAGSETIPGKLMDLAIGQYDLYTTLQLAQYVSTIANGGYRLKPQIVREIREPVSEDELGPVLQPFKPEVLNRIDMPDDQIKRVQEGFRRVYFGSRGTASSSTAKQYKPAGKTGTAETGRGTLTYSLVGYAPYDNPEIAFAVVVPDAAVVGGTIRGGVSTRLGDKVMKTYFDLKEERIKGNVNSSKDDEESEEDEDTEE